MARSRLGTTESPAPGHRCRSSKSTIRWVDCIAGPRLFPPHFESRAGCSHWGSCKSAFAWPTPSCARRHFAKAWNIVAPGTAARCCPCISEFRPCAAGPERTCYTTMHCHQHMPHTRCCSRNWDSCSLLHATTAGGRGRIFRSALFQICWKAVPCQLQLLQKRENHKSIHWLVPSQLLFLQWKVRTQMGSMCVMWLIWIPPSKM